jgi:hypothetical protein
MVENGAVADFAINEFVEIECDVRRECLLAESHNTWFLVCPYEVVTLETPILDVVALDTVGNPSAMAKPLDQRKRHSAWLILPMVGALAQIGACAHIPSRPKRPAPSSYGCMQTVMRDKLARGLSDKQAHCRAAGLIARYCSGPEAYMAGAGKELKDLLGGGDAEWADWRADRAGIACARHASTDIELLRCCELNGY